ncbi:MAG: NADH-quinone oxidoreductase subunit J family protein, partial [Clostridia bacterium]
MVGFIILAVMALGFALAVVVAKHPVHSALALIGHVVTLAIFYLVLQAEFLAAAQVIVYAGAIMVLFLFVVTLLTAGKDDHDPAETLVAQRGLAAFLAIVGGALLAGVAVRVTGAPAAASAPVGYGGLGAMGRLLWGPDFPYLAVVALMLLTAALG